MGISKSKPPVIQRERLKYPITTRCLSDLIVQDFILVWLDAKSSQNAGDFQYTITQLRKTVNTIMLFTNENACLNFIEKRRDEQIFLIVSGTLGCTFVPQIHKFVRVDSIYVFCGKPEYHKWAGNWNKIKLVSNQIERICKSLEEDIVQCQGDESPPSIIGPNDSSNQTLDQIEPSFIYSQLIKEVILEMIYDDKAKDEFVKYCNVIFSKNQEELEIVHEFQQYYDKHSPIWWYTRECFIYQMLNRGLRTVDIDIIVIMSFFIKDIHQNIEEIYSKRSKKMGPFVVYRGQGMLNDEVNKLRNNVHGLLTFNSFLSTSESLTTAMTFARKRANRSNKIPVLFEIEFDPVLTSVPFALVNDVSYYKKKENEILFSMHTVFQINEVKKNDDDNLVKVKLKSVCKDDLQIMRLAEQIRREIGEGAAIDRLGRLMIKLSEFEKAEAVYALLLELTPETDERTIAWIWNQFGYINYMQNKYSDAQSYYDNAIKIQEKLRPSADLDLAATYSNKGLLITSCGDNTDALLYHEKARDIREKLLEVNHPDLAATYCNIGLEYDRRKNFVTALAYYEKTRKIYQSLSPNHPWLATIYHNIGCTQVSMKEYAAGLDNLLKAREIQKLALPSNHPSIASVCSTIASVYREIGDQSNALKFYEEASDIETRAPSVNHSALATTHYNMSLVLNDLEQHDAAVYHAELAVQTASETLDNPDIARFIENFEQLRQKLT